MKNMSDEAFTFMLVMLFIAAAVTGAVIVHAVGVYT
jgi:hypothetical protein